MSQPSSVFPVARDDQGANAALRPTGQVPLDGATALPTERGRAAALVLSARDRHALKLLPGGGDVVGRPVRELVLEGLGDLELADTVFVAREDGQTLGIMFASDDAGTARLITLDLADRGRGNWQATVLGTAHGSTSSRGDSYLGSGESFGFATRMFAPSPNDAA